MEYLDIGYGFGVSERFPDFDVTGEVLQVIAERPWVDKDSGPFSGSVADSEGSQWRIMKKTVRVKSTPPTSRQIEYLLRKYTGKYSTPPGNPEITLRLHYKEAKARFAN